MTTPFNANLHPRAGGGKFGQANNPKAQAGGDANAKLKSQLLARAVSDDKKIAALKAEEHTLRAALASMAHPAAPVSHKSKTTGVTKKGSKTGVAKKTKTTPAKIHKATGVAAKTPASKTSIRSKLILVTGTIHALQQDAKNCRQAAANL